MNNRQYGLIVVLVVVAALVGGLIGAVLTSVFADKPIFAEEIRQHAKVITAEKFLLVDDEGKAHAELTMLDSKSPTLRFIGKGDETLVGLGALSDESSYLAFFDKKGKLRVSLAVSSDGTPALSLYDEEGKKRTELLVSNLVFYDRDERVRVALGLWSYGRAGLSLFDKHRNFSRVALNSDPEGRSSLEFTDEKGNGRIALGFGDEKTIMDVRDNNGKIIWSVP